MDVVNLIFTTLIGKNQFLLGQFFPDSSSFCHSWQKKLTILVHVCAYNRCMSKDNKATFQIFFFEVCIAWCIVYVSTHKSLSLLPVKMLLLLSPSSFPPSSLPSERNSVCSPMIGSKNGVTLSWSNTAKSYCLKYFSNTCF